MDALVLVVWLFSLPILYLIIWLGVKNGMKDAIRELDIRLEQRDGCTALGVWEKERPAKPVDDDEILI